LECVEKIVWPFSLAKFDTLNASIHWHRTPGRHITTAVTTSTWIWFFGFLDDSQQIYGNGFAWFSLAGTHNVFETATSSLIECGAATITSITSSVVVVVIASNHRSSRQACFRTCHARPFRRHKRRCLSRNSPDGPKFTMSI
jgi:hypothetical protein